MKKWQGGPSDRIRITPGPSKTKTRIVLFIYLSALTGVLLSGLSVWIVTVGILLLFLCYIREKSSGNPKLDGDEIIGIVLDENDEWVLETESDSYTAALLPSTRYWERQLFLRFSVDRRRLGFWLPGDAMDENDFRRLKGRLRGLSLFDRED